MVNDVEAHLAKGMTKYTRAPRFSSHAIAPAAGWPTIDCSKTVERQSEAEQISKSGYVDQQRQDALEGGAVV